MTQSALVFAAGVFAMAPDIFACALKWELLFSLTFSVAVLARVSRHSKVEVLLQKIQISKKI